MMPAQILKLALSLALQILIARWLLPEGRGLYGICIAISSVLLVVTYLGNEFGIRYLLGKNRITSSQAFRYLVLTAILSFVATIALAWCIIRFELWLYDGVTWTQLALASTLAFSSLISTQMNVFMTLNGRYRSAAALSIFEELVKVLAVASLLYANNSVEMALIGSIFGSMIIAAFGTMRYNFHKKDYKALRLRDLKFIYKYGVRSFLINLSSISNAHLGTLVLSGLLPNQRIGIYNLAFALVAKAQVVPDALNRVLVPVSMLNKDGDARFRMVQISVTGLLTFSLFVIPIILIFGNRTIVALFGIDYIDAGPIVSVLFTGFACKIIGKPIEAHFNEIAGKPKIVASIQLFNVVSMAVLTYLGATHFGLMGAATGSAMSMALGTAALFAAYARSARRPVLSPISFRMLFDRLCQLLPYRR